MFYKRYLLFCIVDHGATGGLSDVIEEFTTIDDFLDHKETEVFKSSLLSEDELYLFDCDSRKVIWRIDDDRKEINKFPEPTICFKTSAIGIEFDEMITNGDCVISIKPGWRLLNANIEQNRVTGRYIKMEDHYQPREHEIPVGDRKITFKESL